ncbi:MAG: NAD(P)H-hydrate dehydratase [Geobacteraceae bacterium]|nr:NAD(P)H-hydrate dehydratase [Geobacteraceae bacterium]
MKVVSGEIMQSMDRRAIEEFGVSGLTLMENAGRGCAEAIIAGYGSGAGQRAVVVAGKGNNGGDGYVIARLLRERGWQVATFVLARREDIAGDARANLDRLQDGVVVFCPEPRQLGRYVAAFRDATVIVDALLGTGLKSEVRGIYADAIELINGAGKPVVAVDIPSGIDAATGGVLGCAVRAELTVTFALAKLGHVLFPGAEYSGRLRIVDIGIPAEVAASADGCEFLDAAAVRPLLRRRDRCAHKGSFGHCLIVAGSTGKTGAAAMAANSAVRSGAGLVTLAVPAGLNAILEVKTTEAMTLPLPDRGEGHLPAEAKKDILAALAGKDALALGPGLSRQPGTARLVREMAAETELPLVIDADGLNALSEDPSVLLRNKSGALILTPHPGEMARLASMATVDVEGDRIGTAREFAAQHQVFLVLKGARTVIAAPDGRMAINGSGNPGMASGGMGDVLTGVLVALLGQGYDPFSACRLGVFLHGFAADLVAADKGEIGISATDVQERLPFALHQLMTTG